MAITIHLPPEIEQELRRQTPNLDESARDQFLIAQYQQGTLSTADIAEALNFETRYEAQRWLAERGIPVNYSLADLEQDRETFDDLLGRE